jgi:hypothetical protein
LRNTAAILGSLLNDIDGGYLSSLTDKVRVETFDNFLDHAVAYRNQKRKEPASVIAGVVFEDTVRKIYSKKVGPDAGQDLEQIINQLLKHGIITEQQRKELAVPQFVRTKATHANWNAFDLDAVDKTIAFTKVLLKKLHE